MTENHRKRYALCFSSAEDPLSEAEPKPSAVDLATSAGRELEVGADVADPDLDALTGAGLAVESAELDQGA